MTLFLFSSFINTGKRKLFISSSCFKVPYIIKTPHMWNISFWDCVFYGFFCLWTWDQSAPNPGKSFGTSWGHWSSGSLTLAPLERPAKTGRANSPTSTLWILMEQKKIIPRAGCVLRVLEKWCHGLITHIRDRFILDLCFQLRNLIFRQYTPVCLFINF